MTLFLCTLTAAALVVKFYPSENPAFYVLLLLMTIDYISGITAAIYKKNVSSYKGARGILKKFGILLVVVTCFVIDNWIIKSAVIFPVVTAFYISNESISICENAAQLGVPIPKKMLEILAQLKGSDKK